MNHFLEGGLQKQSWMDEVRLHRRLHSARIVQFLGVSVEENQGQPSVPMSLAIVMPFCENPLLKLVLEVSVT